GAGPDPEVVALADWLRTAPAARTGSEPRPAGETARGAEPRERSVRPPEPAGTSPSTHAEAPSPEGAASPAGAASSVEAGSSDEAAAPDHAASRAKSTSPDGGASPDAASPRRRNPSRAGVIVVAAGVGLAAVLAAVLLRPETN